MKRSLAGAAVYRARQFFGALTANGLTSAEQAFVRQSLTPAQQVLFRRMSDNDQRHVMAVARTLVNRGWAEPALIQAALLHDAGKADCDLNLVYRVAIVLLGAFWPSLLCRLSKTDAGWRRPFYCHAHHPERGAEMAAAAGSSSAVVALIRQHEVRASSNQTMPADRWLRALQAADEMH